MPSSLNGTSGETLTNVMDNVAGALNYAKPHGLECEVIAVAMIFLKENPKASIEEALVAGLGDWDI